MNILIAEREQIVSEVICDLLETHTTNSAYTVSDAIKKYADTQYDLVIFSMTITDKDLADKSEKEKIEEVINYGPGTGVRKFMKEYPDARVVILTGFEKGDLSLSEFKAKNIEIIYESSWENIKDIVN